MPSVQLPKNEALIVDDDVRARELLSEFCRGQGFEVATAHDGRAAIAAIARDPGQFAVIITDLHLPGADGFEVLKAAREANSSVYVVMITGYASIDSVFRAVPVTVTSDGTILVLVERRTKQTPVSSARSMPRSTRCSGS